MTAPFQLFPTLAPAVESALRESIRRFGVIVPVVVDQDGRVIDGHHRCDIALELGVECPTIVRHVDGDDHAAELARTLNMDRRHLDPDVRQGITRPCGHPTCRPPQEPQR